MLRIRLVHLPWLFLAPLTLTLEPAVARALEPQRFSLNWVREPGAESCSTSHRLTTLVQSAFGPVIATPDEADLAIEGRVGKHDATWRAHIAISDRDGNVLGRRELATTEPECRALDAQILLVIAIAIDPEIALEGLSDELLKQLASSSDPAEELLAELKQQAAKSEATRANAHHAPTHVAASAQAKRPAQDAPGKPAAAEPQAALLDVRLLPVLSLGHQPSAALGLGLGVSLRPLARWSVEALGAWLAPKELAIDDPTVRRASVTFELSLFALFACGAPVLTPALRWSVCAGTLLAVRGVQARGLASDSSGTRVAVGPALGSSVALGLWAPFSVSLGASLDAPLRRPRYSYRVGPLDSVVWRPAALGFAMFLGVGVEV